MDPLGLNFTDQELMKYIFYEEMRNMDGGVLLTGFDIDNSLFTPWYWINYKQITSNNS